MNFAQLIQMYKDYPEKDVNELDSDGVSIVYRTFDPFAKNYKLDDIKFLLRKGFNINAPTGYYGNTFMFRVFEYGLEECFEDNNDEFFKYLLENGGDITSTNSRGENMYIYCDTDYNPSAYYRFCLYGGDVCAPATNPFNPGTDENVPFLRLMKHLMCYGMHEDILELTFQKHPHLVTYKTPLENLSPLQYFCKTSSAEPYMALPFMDDLLGKLIDVFVDNGADINHRDINGNNFLHWLAGLCNSLHDNDDSGSELTSRCINVVFHCIDAGVDKDAVNTRGKKPVEILRRSAALMTAFRGEEASLRLLDYPARIIAEVNREKDCPVAMEPLKNFDTVYVNYCGHVFSCDNFTTCPVCREDIHFTKVSF